jgi:hypothetical protein
MSQHQAFRRAAVPAQIAQKLETVTIPAPTRGIIQNENEAYMQPGGAVICDNWKPTMKGVSLRGGCILRAQLPETTPVLSAFEYASGDTRKMFFANATKVYDATDTVPVAIATGRTSGNYVASQMSNQGGDWMLALNDAGDAPLRFNGSTWTSMATTTPANWVISHAYAAGDRARDDDDGSRWVCAVAHTSPATGTFSADRAATPGRWTIENSPDGAVWIIGPADTPVENGLNLTYVCKYRNRWFFVEKDSMNAWYLPLNAIGGQLSLIPLSGAASKGGKLIFCANWSIDAGDGTDDKIVFMTDLGEILVFTGGDPSNPAAWRQEGRYDMSPPMGMNAHVAIGGDLLVATVDGILPVSGAITKGKVELELAAVTRTIKNLWRSQVNEKRSQHWSFCKWDEYGAMFTTFPGGVPGKYWCLVTNLATGAHGRFVGWDVMCMARLYEDMFFGTQTGQIMQADRTGYDNGKPYLATLVGSWEVFQSPSQTVTWRQSRATFSAKVGEPFQPQIYATVDYIISLPPPPQAGYDTSALDLWDSGLWDDAIWDAGVAPVQVIRNTGWVSIGLTGYSHAPVVQVTVAQQLKPEVDLINIAATFERDGVNV